MDSGQRTVFTPAYNSQPDFNDLLSLKADFIDKLELEGWDIFGLDHYDAAGEFQCPACSRKENEG